MIDNHTDVMMRTSAEALSTVAVTVSLAAGTGLLEVLARVRKWWLK